MNKFWQIKNLSDTEAELILYGEIADVRPWWDYEKQIPLIVSTEFLDDIRILNTKSEITIRLNSPGGDVVTAIAICNQLRTLKAYKTLIVDAVAASAAIMFLMVVDKVISPSNALYLIHKPAVYTYGDAMDEDDLAKLDQALKTVKDVIMETYQQKLNLSKEEIDKIMLDAKWLTAYEAKDLGLVDEILFDKQADITASADRKYLFTNSIKMDIGQYKSKPDAKIVNIRKEDEEPMKFENVAQFEKEYPALAAEIRNAAITDERQRQMDIDAISAQIPREMVNEAKYTKPIAASELAMSALKANASLGAAYINNAKTDAEESGAGEVGGTPEAPPDGKQTAQNKSIGGRFRNIVAGLDRSVSITGE